MGILEGLGLAGILGKFAAIGGVLLAVLLAVLGIRRGAKREERAEAKAADAELRAEAEGKSIDAYLKEKAGGPPGGMADLVKRVRGRGGPKT